MPRRPFRSIPASLASTLLMILPIGAPVRASEPCWTPPVDGSVVDGFREPDCPWCAGNRGIEYAVGSRSTVRSVAAGLVEFAGVVAGERYVVVRLPTGWRITYGRLAGSNVQLGDAVLTGTAIGVADGEFYFGLRIGERYADPAPYLGVASGQRRLVPLDGRPARPARWAGPRCGGDVGSR